MLLDAHVHFWKLDRGDYSWPTSDLEVLYRDYLPSDLYGSLDAHNVSGIIAVQATATLEETKFLLALAEKERCILGVVGWLDLGSSRFHSMYDQMRANPYFIGMRPMLHVVNNKRWVLEDGVIENLKYLAENDFPVDIIVGAEHLPVIIELLHRIPNLRTAINHIGYPPVNEGLFNPWATYMSELAQNPHVMCKLSGLLTIAGGLNPTAIQEHAYHLFDVFGAKRLIFGTDWPVALLAGDYADAIKLFHLVLPPSISEIELAAVRGLNAIEFYKLNHWVKSAEVS